MHFCIVGTGRCGSTLLQKMMNSHPELFVYPETHWLPELHRRFGNSEATPEAMLDLIQRTRHVTGKPTNSFDRDAFLAEAKLTNLTTVPALSNALGQYLAGLDGKRLWADKTPDYGNVGQMLQQYWPDCKIIHVIRNGVQVATSMSKHRGYRTLARLGQEYWHSIAIDFVPRRQQIKSIPMSVFTSLWYNRLIRIRDEATRLLPGSYLEIRYEELLGDPRRALKKMVKFVDIPVDDDWLQRASDMVVRKPASTKGNEKVIVALDERQRDLMERLGYQLL